MKQKVIYGATLIGTFFVGIIGTILVIHYMPEAKYVDRTVQTVSIKETDTIKSAINKIYKAVFVIESYQGNRLIGTGTGFVYKKDDKQAYIVTNHHVIDGSTEIKVIDYEGREIKATKLGSDEYSDVAVLSIDEASAPVVAELGDSSKLELGDTLFTVGSPMGSDYRGSVTKGILSGKDRTVSVTLSNGDFMMQLLQTDAAINPGNSGGPLVNINGQVIGMNSLKLVKDTIEGMGFAIPIEIVQSEVAYLEKGEEIKRPLVGIESVDASNTYAIYSNQLSVEKDFSNGIVIASVQSDTPASKAGFQKNDVIVEVNGTKIIDNGHFRYLIYKCKIGDTVTVKYYRGKDLKEAKVTLNKTIG